ncbi:MAG: U32 family peptidase [Eubacteriales bacterium]|nr:U32 family peptidase [Eubacteriales bacterium]
MINSVKKPEILAPCGSYDILVAAIKAGADACYIGGNRFSARAYAENLQEDQIIKAIDYAHLHDTKLYLTVNTLIKNDEIKMLFEYLLPYYEAGIDAVIVQDLGAFSLIHDTFPDLPIHCSTQMNINSVYGATLMKKQGASRVVTAREMPLHEIRIIKEQLDIEVETFVHGAMCYSYSGQCLMSSLAGGRSGNRGRCAQPCRKCYDGDYSLSMKDLCTLSNLPKLIEAGIDSLKIEGRMKNAYYVVSAVEAYKELAQDAVKGLFDSQKVKYYKDRLADVFNRGGFTDGYFFMHNHESMISKERPNNQGTLVGTVKNVIDGKVQIALSKPLYKGDVLELAVRDNKPIEITTSKAYASNKLALLPAPKTRLIKKNAFVYRTRCNKLLQEINENILSKDKKICVSAMFSAKVGQNMSMMLWDTVGNEVVVYYDVIDKSEKVKTDIAQVKNKLLQTGDTEYSIVDLSLEIDDDAFIPAGKLKQIRREAIAAYEEKLLMKYRRTHHKVCVTTEHFVPEMKKAVTKQFSESLYYAKISTLEQLIAIVQSDYINGVFMDLSVYDRAEAEGIVDRLKAANKHIFICLPYIIDSKFDFLSCLQKSYIHGIYIRNIDGLACVYQAYRKHCLPDNFEIYAAHSLYAFNDVASTYLRRLLPMLQIETSYELNQNEINKLAYHPDMSLIYGYQRVMLSAQCIRKTKYGCNHANETIQITDDKRNTFYAKCMCEGCYNVIYNGHPLCLFDKQKELLEVNHSKSLLLSFTTENRQETEEVLSMLSIDGQHENSHRFYTRGHFYRGVE